MADNDSFRDSLNKSASFPKSLVYHRAYEHVLEAHVDRLNEQDDRLFSCEDKTNLELWEYGAQSTGFKSHHFNNSTQLRNHFVGGQLFAEVDPQCRFMFVHAAHSRAKLKVTRYMLTVALTYHQAMAPFVDFLFSFGKQEYPRDFHFSGFYHETHLNNDQPNLHLPDLGRSGTDFKMCYNLKSVEPSSSQPHFPWSVRQLAVYHSFDVVTGKAFWTMIKGDELIKQRIKAATNPDNHPNLDMSSAAQAFCVALTVQLIIFDWCREQWRWYISYLEGLQEITTCRALTMRFDRPSARPAQPSNISPPRAATTPPGKIKRAVTRIFRRASLAIRTLSPSIPLAPILHPAAPPPEFEPDFESTELFSFSDLQNVQSYEEKVSELLLVIRSNIKIVSDIKAYYMDLVASTNFPDEIKTGCSSKIRDFEKTVFSIVNDLEMQHSRASMLLSTLTNRKGLLNGALNYCNMEASKRFAEKAAASTSEMQIMTEEMNALAQKTKQETVSMRIITLVTLFFLPGTFISTIMSTDILQYSKIPDTNNFKEDYSSTALKRYATITLPLMAMTFAAWAWLYLTATTRRGGWSLHSSVLVKSAKTTIFEGSGGSTILGSLDDTGSQSKGNAKCRLGRLMQKRVSYLKMQSGISASQELHTAFQTLVSTESQRGLLVTIEKESLVPSAILSPSTGSFTSDLSLLTPHITPKTALYIILRRYETSSPAPFVAITYVPDAAPVRQKMLFASTRLTLVRELGIERFRESIFANREDELTEAGFKKHDKHNELEAPLTEEEVSLGEVKRKEAEEGRGMSERKSHVSSGVSMPITDDALAALKSLASGDGEGDNLVQLKIDIPTETMELASITSTPIESLPTTISPTEPRYSVYRFAHSHNGETTSPILFIYTCPSGSKVKERMLYAASSRSAVQVAEAEAGLKIERRIESSSPEDVTEESIMEDLHPKVEVKRAFERPKRPGRR
ncbi:uncharacterized protein BP5553_10445 [Venustampulla echinocandica]|uniref:Twinfilin n=1 Tax=Venustampulla echinocandica TaxID=2656787 RepID=A0A370T9B2_9HELO|nr:uncharacterized protein BP5553_10445 [Venustampulla echinocandica]RDL30167.1 hypothetical protein BP5553_10445 [Venustampulla echinocandica]